MNFLLYASVLVVASVSLIVLIRTSLAQRETARRFRSVFISEANDLIAKPEFPEDHAKLLIGMASIPQGWATRFGVLALAKRMFVGGKRRSSSAPHFQQVPEALRTKYVVAILAFALSDSYHCVILGRIFRATHSWLPEAVHEPKSDINAHATQVVIEEVSLASSSKRRSRERELAPA